jgi:hypothetical protein
MALGECRVTFRGVRDIDHSVTVPAVTTMGAAALGPKRIQEQQFVMEDLADRFTVDLVSSTRHNGRLFTPKIAGHLQATSFGSGGRSYSGFPDHDSSGSVYGWPQTEVASGAARTPKPAAAPQSIPKWHCQPLIYRRIIP